MSSPVPFLTTAQGFFRDKPRGDLPSGFVWDLVDYLPDLGGNTVKRGGWTRFSTAITATTNVSSVAFAQFPAATSLFFITDNGAIGTLNLSTGAPTVLTGTSTVPKQNPFVHKGYLIIPSADGTTSGSVMYVAVGGGTVQTLTGTGTVPLGRYGCVYRDRTVLASAGSAERTVYFSDPPAAGASTGPTTWNASGFWNTTYPITGIAPIATALLIFSDGHTERLRGTTPPPNGDMALEPLFDHGCIDARSIVTTGGNVIFANAEGIFLTDGAAAVDLTLKGGIQTYWRDLLSTSGAAGGVDSTWTFAAGLFNNRYVICVMKATTLVATLMCNLDTRTWTRVANVKTKSFAHAVATTEKLYYGALAEKYVNEISTFWQPSVTTKNDGDGTAVTPVIETAFVRGSARLNRRYITSQGPQTWKSIFIDYDMPADTGSPVLQMSYIKSPEATVYATLGGTLPKTGTSTSEPVTRKLTRARRNLGVSSVGIAIKIAQTIASDATIIYSIESDSQSRETSRLT